MRSPSESQLLVIVWAALMLSAACFILLSNHPVSDDPYNLPDVLRYARSGVTTASLKAHINPAGPLSYVIIAAFGTPLGGALWSYRLVNLLCFAVLFALLYRRSLGGMQYAAAAILVLTNPYLPLASATILTELPALLVFMAGVALWMSGLDRLADPAAQEQPIRDVVTFLAGSLLLGASVIARQYYAAVLPAMLGILLVALRRLPSRARGPFCRLSIASMALALMPVVGLIALWGGMTAPSIRTNVSYQQFNADIGFSFVRPVTAAVLIGVYALPPLGLQRGHTLHRSARFSMAAAAASLILHALVPVQNLWCTGGQIVHCGMIDGAYWLIHRRSEILALAFSWSAMAAGCLGLIYLGHAFLNGSATGPPRHGPAFAVAFLLLFVLEQMFVGGSIPFYERYVLQVAPMIGFAIASGGGFSTSRAMAGSLPLVIFGQLRLWRYL